MRIKSMFFSFKNNSFSKFFICLIFLFKFSSLVLAQDLPKIKAEILSSEDFQLIENSVQKFKKSKNDTLRILAILEIVDNCWNEKVWPKYNEFLIQFIDNIDKSKLDKKTLFFLNSKNAECINNKGFWYGENGEVDKQKDFYLKSLDLRLKIKDKTGIANSYNNLGYVYDKQGNISLALEYYLKSLKIKEEIHDSIGIANTLVNLGYNYDKLNYLEKALFFYKRSLKIRKLINDEYGMSNSYNQIATVYGKLAQKNKHKDNRQLYLIKSLELYEKALRINKKIGNKNGIAEAYTNIGSYYQIQNKLDNALSFYLKSYKIQEEISDYKGAASTLNYIGNIYFVKNQLNEAEKYGTKSYQISKSVGYPQEIAGSAKLLFEINKRKSNYKEALKYHELHISMRDSISNEETARENIQMNLQYDFEKQKVFDSIKAHEKAKIKDAEIETQKAKLSQQRTQNLALFGGIILIALFFVIIFNRFKKSQKQNIIIKKQKNEVENQNKLIEEQHFLLEEKSKEITDSIKYAERIQGAILPPEQKWNYILPNSFILNKPKDILSGDFYWIAETEERIFVAAADCTGHGVPGALISIVNFNLLNKAVLERGLSSPSEILDAVNVWLTESLNQTTHESSIKDGMDIALISINKKNGQVLYSGANNPLYIFSNNELREYKADKFPVGAYANEKLNNFSTKEIQTKFGDTIYLFSDGFADQFGGENGKKFKYKQFKESLFQAKDLPIEKQQEFLNKKYREWRGKLEQTDDILIIGIKI